MDHLSEQLFELQGNKMERGLKIYKSFFIVQKPLRRSQLMFENLYKQQYYAIAISITECIKLMLITMHL